MSRYWKNAKIASTQLKRTYEPLNVEKCIENRHPGSTLCFLYRRCDLAFMIVSTCVAVQCSNEELCQTIKAKPNNKFPRVAYIRRKERKHKHRGNLSFSFFQCENRVQSFSLYCTMTLSIKTISFWRINAKAILILLI